MADGNDHPYGCGLPPVLRTTPLINVGGKGVEVSPYSVRLKRNHETRSKSVDKRKTGRYNEIPFYGREQTR